MRQQLRNCTWFNHGNVNRAKTRRGSQCTPRLDIYDLHDRIIPYEEAWQWQKMLVDRTLQIDENEDVGSLGAVVILQHEPVYTLGEGSTVNHVLFDRNKPPFPLFRIERGGEVTYHGPGQLVMYPILNLKYLKTDLHWYLRSLEEIVIQTLENVSGIHGNRIDGLTGVWVKDEKVAAIGIRATRWVTYHGLALNVTADLAPFANIVPCGIGDKKVTSVLKIEGHDRQLEDVYQDTVFRDQMLNEYSYGLLDAFGTVFGIDVDSSEQCRFVDGDVATNELKSLYSECIGNKFSINRKV